MGTHLGAFVVALIIGAYLGASFSDSIGTTLQQAHVPLLGHHSPTMSP
jgi:hypothetical protein